MSKLPVLSGQEVIKILSKTGYTITRQKISHIILTKIIHVNKKSVVIPNHQEIDKGTFAEIIRQAGMTKEQFMSLI
jgi:predicted RNA binding protein YcfA (HicA-like mRNA interferase family)